MPRSAQNGVRIILLWIKGKFYQLFMITKYLPICWPAFHSIFKPKTVFGRILLQFNIINIILNLINLTNLTEEEIHIS